MPKILHYLIMSKLLLSNVRFSALFRRLEESTQWPQNQRLGNLDSGHICPLRMWLLEKYVLRVVGNPLVSK